MTDGSPAAAAAWLKWIAAECWSIVKTAMTGPDNQSWAPGRIMGFAVFVVGQCLVIRASAQMLSGKPSVADWLAFFGGVSTFEAAICATCVGLVTLGGVVEKGGAFWKANGPDKAGQ